MKPAAIITADNHYRDDIPGCRVDNFWNATIKKHCQLLQEQQRYKIPNLNGGDYFNNWDSSAFLEGWLIRTLNYYGQQTITVPGNHELPDHNTNKLDKSSLSVLEAAGVINILKGCYEDPIKIPAVSNKYDFHLVYGFPYGSTFNKNAELKIPEDCKGKKFLKIALAHIFAYTEYREWMSKNAIKISAINRLAHQFDLIVTGHNHQCFISKTKENLVVNPGSMMRIRTNQMDYKPAYFEWFDEDNSVHPVYFDIEDNVLIKQDIKITSISEELNGDEYINEDIGDLFKNNLQLYFNKNNTREQVVSYIDKSRR